MLPPIHPDALNLSQAEAATVIGVSQATLRAWLKALPARRRRADRARGNADDRDGRAMRAASWARPGHGNAANCQHSAGGGHFPAKGRAS
jgi:hypothetical protein